MRQGLCPNPNLSRCILFFCPCLGRCSRRRSCCATSRRGRGRLGAVVLRLFGTCCDLLTGMATGQWPGESGCEPTRPSRSCCATRRASNCDFALLRCGGGSCGACHVDWAGGLHWLPMDCVECMRLHAEALALAVQGCWLGLRWALERLQR